jgi:putative transposase
MTKVEEKPVAKEASPLDEIARRGAQRMIEAAMEVEVEQYVTQLRGHRDERGHAQVVRNGHGQERTVTVGSGTMRLRAPRVNDKRVLDGERQRRVSGQALKRASHF